MNTTIIAVILILYFVLLVIIARITSKGATEESFFNGNKRSPWFLVAYGMIGASLSGITFISIPGKVLFSQFAYFQIVLGYVAGYAVIGLILLPLYYKLNLVSIYGYLEKRFGYFTYKTGALFFILSRTIGAAFRLFLAVVALQLGLFDALGVPFWLTTIISISLVWVYTFKGGIKTIVWTDTLQTTFLLLALVTSIFLIKDELNLTMDGLVQTIGDSKMSKIFFWDVKDSKFFFKHFFSGMFMAIVMTGLDQDMMQKNLSCKNLKDAQKNMFWFTVILVVANFVFLCLGALLYIYAEAQSVPLPTAKGIILTDKVYPYLAFNHFSTFASVVFLLGITAATYSSSDSALTALTTSVCVDFLDIEKVKVEKRKAIIRKVHVAFSVLLLIVILLFKMIKDVYPDTNVIGALFDAAGFTYGPLLGLFTFGLFTKWQVKDKFVPLVCVIAPILSYLIKVYLPIWFDGFQLGFLIILVNGVLTFIGLLILRKKETVATLI